MCVCALCVPWVYGCVYVCVCVLCVPWVCVGVCMCVCVSVFFVFRGRMGVCYVCACVCVSVVCVCVCVCVCVFCVRATMLPRSRLKCKRATRPMACPHVPCLI